MRILGIETTPNPDAIKLLLASRQTGGIRSYRPGESAGDDALGRDLLALEGVRGVLIHEQFITLTRDPGVDWTRLRKNAEDALRAHPE
jgi:hypothetical protein